MTTRKAWTLPVLVDHELLALLDEIEALGMTMIDLTEAHAYFHKGTGNNGDIDTWFVPVDGPGTYRLIREDGGV